MARALAARVQPSAVGVDAIARDLTRILHGGFTGLIEAHCERGRITRWDSTESLKGGRVLRPTIPARKEVEWYAEELLALAAGLTGWVRLKCMDGAVVQYERRQTLLAGDLVPLEE